MNYNYKNKNNSTTGIRLMCAIVFVIFSLAWLFFFQADILAMTQHVLSGGLTHYNRTLGALIITFVLLLVQTGVYKLTNLRRQAYALTYVPSMLMLALSSVQASTAPCRKRNMTVGSPMARFWT